MRALEGKVEDSPEQEDDFIKAVAEATGKVGCNGEFFSQLSCMCGLR